MFYKVVLGLIISVSSVAQNIVLDPIDVFEDQKKAAKKKEEQKKGNIPISRSDGEKCKAQVTNAKGVTGTYIGECLQNEPEGRGRIKYVNGDFYSGEVSFGSHEGFGEIFFADGSEYSGEWRNGKFHGEGLLKEENRQYEGSFKLGLFHGQGRLEEDGKVVEGIFENGATSDQVSLRLEEIGANYIGEIFGQLPNGKGALTYDNGKTLKGYFDNGFFVGSFLGSQISYRIDLKKVDPFREYPEANCMVYVESGKPVSGMFIGTCIKGVPKKGMISNSTKNSNGYSKAIGEFKSGNLTGEGVVEKYYFGKISSITEGAWKNGVLHGYGVVKQDSYFGGDSRKLMTVKRGNFENGEVKNGEAVDEVPAYYINSLLRNGFYRNSFERQNVSIYAKGYKENGVFVGNNIKLFADALYLGEVSFDGKTYKDVKIGIQDLTIEGDFDENFNPIKVRYTDPFMSYSCSIPRDANVPYCIYEYKSGVKAIGLIAFQDNYDVNQWNRFNFDRAIHFPTEGVKQYPNGWKAHGYFAKRDFKYNALNETPYFGYKANDETARKKGYTSSYPVTFFGDDSDNIKVCSRDVDFNNYKAKCYYTGSWSNKYTEYSHLKKTRTEDSSAANRKISKQHYPSNRLRAVLNALGETSYFFQYN